MGRRGRGAEPSRRRNHRQPDHPGRPRGGGHGRRQRRQARLDREAVLPGPGIRARPAEDRRRRRDPPGLRPGHVPGRRAADRPADDRTRRHRHPADRHDHVPDRRARNPGTPTRRSSSSTAPARCSTWARTTSPRWSRPSAPSARSPPSAPRPRTVRVIGSGPKAGEEFTVEVPTHVSAMAQFEGGASSHSVF